MMMFAPERASVNLRLNAGGIILAAGAGAAALSLLRRDRVVAAGYLLSLTMFVLGAVTLFISPESVHFSGAAMILATLVAGAIVGGSAGFVFAGGSILVTVASWVVALVSERGALSQLSPETRFIFLLSVSVGSAATAAILQSLSRQMRRTIERLHSQAQRLATLANTDPLTQLANRRYLLEQLEREFDRARRYRRPLSLVYLDLDGFKAINDEFGHLFGDEVLRGAAKSMRAVLRSSDLMARIGGDEFAALMPETAQQGAIQACDKLRRALTAYSRQMEDSIPPLSFCAGVSQIRTDDASIDPMLRRADKAQYQAKSSGKGLTMTQDDIEE